MTAAAPARTLLRDSKRTRQNILAAAVECFATRGFATTGMRDIATQAGVNPSLIVRYFGSKEALYEEAIYSVLDVSPQVSDRVGFGHRLAERLSRHGSGPAVATSILVLGSADPAAAQIAMTALRKSVFGRLAVWLGAPDAELRATQISLIASGFLLYTKLLPILDPDQHDMEQMVAWLGDSIQEIVDRPQATLKRA